MNSEELNKLRKQYIRERDIKKRILELQDEIPVSEFEEMVIDMNIYKDEYDPFLEDENDFEDIVCRIKELKEDEQVKEYCQLVKSLKNYDVEEGIELDDDGELDEDEVLKNIIEDFTTNDDKGIYIYLGSYYSGGSYFETYTSTCKYNSDEEQFRKYKNLETQQVIIRGLPNKADNNYHYNTYGSAEEFEKTHRVFDTCEMEDKSDVGRKNRFPYARLEFIKESIEKDQEQGIKKLEKIYRNL